jgi:hypothetical protein
VIGFGPSTDSFQDVDHILQPLSLTSSSNSKLETLLKKEKRKKEMRIKITRTIINNIVANFTTFTLQVNAFSYTLDKL